jgi:hypothetical protein
MLQLKQRSNKPSSKSQKRGATIIEAANDAKGGLSGIKTKIDFEKKCGEFLCNQSDKFIDNLATDSLTFFGSIQFSKEWVFSTFFPCFELMEFLDRQYSSSEASLYPLLLHLITAFLQLSPQTDEFVIQAKQGFEVEDNEQIDEEADIAESSGGTNFKFRVLIEEFIKKGLLKGFVELIVTRYREPKKALVIEAKKVIAEVALENPGFWQLCAEMHVCASNNEDDEPIYGVLTTFHDWIVVKLEGGVFCYSSRLSLVKTHHSGVLCAGDEMEVVMFFLLRSLGLELEFKLHHSERIQQFKDQVSRRTESFADSYGQISSYQLQREKNLQQGKENAKDLRLIKFLLNEEGSTQQSILSEIQRPSIDGLFDCLDETEKKKWLVLNPA